jgi:8-oxo-dGTP pyrophosphatase MutT (NUDIX family)
MDLRKIVGHRTLLMPAAALVIGDGKGNVLLQLRADDKTWANHGGSIELDEKVEDALAREVKEELGITILEYKLLNIYSGPNYHNIYPNGDEVSCIDITYYCHKFEGNIMLQEDEVLEVKWFNKDNLPENLHHNSVLALKDYFRILEERK